VDSRNGTAQGWLARADLQVEEPRKDGSNKEESHVLQTLRRRLQGEREGGFTLIELMVVVLIIAILIAIAIPTFLGARTRAQDRAAQASLRNTLVAAKSIYTDAQSYATAEGAGLTAVEPSLTYKAKGTASTGPNDVSADGSTTSTNIWSAAALSASGTCFWIKDDVSAGTTYGTGATCTGTAARAAAATKW
jgi:type IV pilus assembly protein PilA